MRKLPVFLVIIIFLTILSSPVLAQPARPVSPTCDLCGYCVGGDYPSNWQKCVDCVYENYDNAIVKEGYNWTVFGCLPTQAGGFVQNIVSFVIAIAGGITLLMLIFGGFLILTSSGDSERLATGKNIILSSILGLLLIIFSVFLLNFIGYQILKIPGFGG